MYVYASKIAARHPQIDYNSKSGYRAKLKFSSRQIQAIEEANGHPALDLVGIGGV